MNTAANTPTIADTLSRAELLQRLERFIAQRPGFSPANYGDSASYRADARTATRQLNDARAMLAAISWRESSITADDIRAALRSGGRLTLRDDGTLDYCTGQYWPTEYRAGVCRVLATILWDYWRDNMPARDGNGKIPGPNRFGGAMSPGDYLRRTARAELGRTIADRWFR